MKRLILLTILFVGLSPSITLSQSCFPQGIWFTTQEQLDCFQNNFPWCNVVEGYVVINGSNITNLNGLNTLTAIGGDLRIINCNALIDFTGLENLTSIGGDFSVGDIHLGGNDSIKDFAGLSSLNEISGNFNTIIAPSLINFSGLESLETIGGNVTIGCLISGNDSLKSLLGLNNLISISGDLSIVWNDNLESVNGLNSLNLIEGNLIVQGNNSLVDFTGLGNLSSIEGNFEIRYNSSLINLTGINLLNRIGGSLNIDWNYSLASLYGINHLNIIEGDLTLINNDALNNVLGFNDLYYVGGFINIYHNNTLSNLSGFPSISPDSINELVITDNYSLCNCSVESICEYLDMPSSLIEIHDNAAGCNSLDQVIENCEPLYLNEAVPLKVLEAYPNPFSSSICIKYELISSEEVIISIYNFSGINVYNVKFQQARGVNYIVWEAEGLPCGMYNINIKLGNKNYSKIVSKGK